MGLAQQLDVTFGYVEFVDRRLDPPIGERSAVFGLAPSFVGAGPEAQLCYDIPKGNTNTPGTDRKAKGLYESEIRYPKRSTIDPR